jgi:hypothetical protein
MGKLNTYESLHSTSGLCIFLFVAAAWRDPALRDWSRSNLMQEEKSDQNIVLNSTSNADPVARDTRQEDRTFLDDLVHRIDRPETCNLRLKPVPRAELVSNTEMVRRAELVTRGGIIKNKHLPHVAMN